MNKAILVGRLVRDIELRTVGDNKTMARFTLAVDRQLSKDKKVEMENKNQPTADFISVVAWGKQAETLANYLSKGRMIAISGRIQTGSYEKDGQKVYTTDVVVEDFTFVDSPSRGNGQAKTNNKSTNGENPAQGVEDLDNFYSEEDIPF